MTFSQLLLVFAGGGTGATLRWLLAASVSKIFGTGFPFGTLAVNLIGCFAMGFIAEIWARHAELSADIRLFLMTGLLGGFTTFSSFALEAVSLAGRGLFGLSALYAVGSAAAGILCCTGGIMLARGCF